MTQNIDNVRLQGEGGSNYGVVTSNYIDSFKNKSIITSDVYKNILHCSRSNTNFILNS